MGPKLRDPRPSDAMRVKRDLVTFATLLTGPVIRGDMREETPSLSAKEPHLDINARSRNGTSAGIGASA